jgi:uncharacterized protein YjaG (DUF416 family)
LGSHLAYVKFSNASAKYYSPTSAVDGIIIFLKQKDIQTVCTNETQKALDKIYKQYDMKGHAYNIRVFSQSRTHEIAAIMQLKHDLLQGLKIHG